MVGMFDHILVNPNQLRHYGTRVQDNPTSESPLSIRNEYWEFRTELSTEGTIVFANTNKHIQFMIIRYNNACKSISYHHILGIQYNFTLQSYLDRLSR